MKNILLVSVCLILTNFIVYTHSRHAGYDDMLKELYNQVYKRNSEVEENNNLREYLNENVRKDELLTNGRVYDYDELLSSSSRLPLHEDEREDFIDENLNELQDENRLDYHDEPQYNENEQYEREYENPNVNNRNLFHDGYNRDNKNNGNIISRKEKLSSKDAEHKVNHVEVSKHKPKYHSNNNVEEVTSPVTETKVLKMPGVSPKEMDTYLCFALELPADDRYIVEFTPLAEMQTAHHMLLFGCETPYKKDTTWNCREMAPVCGTGNQRIMYAWAKNAPALKMPENVGVHVGKNSGVNYLVLQVHYLNVDKFKNGATDESGVKFMMTEQRKRFLAGILLLADGWTVIPPHKKKAHIDMGCTYMPNSPRIYPFRFRTHAHKLGVVITGYRIRNGKWKLIGRGDPQRPQAFYRTMNELDVRPGDKLFGRCTYNSMKRDGATHIGATHSDEMCNFYMMYYFDSYHGSESNIECYPANTDGVKYPKDSDTALAVMEAKQNGLNKEMFSVVHGWPSHKGEDGDLKAVGQIAGVAYDKQNDQVLIFHRGERVWDMDTFDRHNNLRKKYKSTIPQKTLIWLDRATGKVVKSAGERMFNVPHGVTFDHDGNIWVTDVGAHQVFKLSPELDKKTKNVKVLLSIGERFVNGDDSKHFCKPTDVAVMKNGEFFVADGYCNSRIIKFDKNGRSIMEISETTFVDIAPFPAPKFMAVVHSLALDEENNRLFVADRENGRVLIFNTDGGEFIDHISKSFQNGAVYAIAYNSHDGGVLHVVTGSRGLIPIQPSGFTYSLKTNRTISKWGPDQEKGTSQDVDVKNQGLVTPHDVAVSPNNRYIFVSEINPNKIWAFKSNKSLRP